MLRASALLLLSFISIASFGQGSVTGVITDAKTKDPVIGANVVIQGTTIGGATDIEGRFLISKVAAGTYTLQVTSMTYKTHLIPNLVVEDAKRVSVDVPLSEDVSELQEVVVTSGRAYDTDFELLRSIKEMKLVVVGITSEQISKTLDRDAAQVLRRVPGITIKDNQFVQIRGLSERYNPVMLHNVYAPSVETDVRSFSFATLPSNQLERMLVFKSPSADNPGDFAGGVVKVFTKSIPEENGIVVEYSTQVRAGTTFKDFYHQQTGNGQLTGFNTGFYDLPAYFPANASKVHGDVLVNAGKSLKNLWTPVKGMAIPDQRFAVTFNRKFNVGKVQIGNISALTYSNSFATYAVQRGDYTDTNNSPETLAGFQDKQYNQFIRTGFLFNWAFRFNPGNTIEFKNLYNQSSTDQYVDRSGTVNTPTGGQKNGSFDKVYRGIYSGQLMGTHDLFRKRTSVEWVAGYNSSNRDQPDYKRYQSLDLGNGTAQINVPNTVTPTALGRFYAKLNERAYSGGLSVKQRFGFSDNPLRSPELKAGVFFENKSRSFNARNIGYTQSTASFDQNLSYLPIGDLFQPQNINKTTGIQLGEITYLRDSYSASNNLLAYYLMTSLPIGGKIKLDAGARLENNLQQLNSYDDFKPADEAPVHVHNQVNRLLPSANVSYNFTEKMLVRAAYGQTLNRPEFRELAPFAFYDFNFNFVYYGNPALKTAKIQNLDLRWEFYPGKTELITFGGFYKQFTDPIEAYVDVSGNKLVTYANSQSATLYGLEVEIKKSLSGLTGSRLLNNINVLFNSAVTKSTVNIASAYATGRSTARPLQGQAPYVINTGIFYNSDLSGWQVNLLYNVVGKSVFLVGTDFYHDVYLMPRHVVDLTFSKRVGRFQVKGGVSDIFNQPWLLLQDGNGDKKLDPKTDQVIQKFKPGQVFSIGFSVRL